MPDTAQISQEHAPDVPSNENSSKLIRYILFFVLFLSTGLLGNVLQAPLFFSVSLIFGSISVILSARYMGAQKSGMPRVMGILGTTLLAAIIGSYSYVLWDHPYAIVIFTLEGLFVSLFTKRYRNLILLNILYWVLIGAPLVLVFYGLVIGIPWLQTWTIAIKQPINGIFNTVIATYIIMFITWRADHARKLPIRDLIFNTIFGVILIPSMVLIILEARSGKRIIEQDIYDEMTLATQFITDEFKMNKRLQDHMTEEHQAVRNIHEMHQTEISGIRFSIHHRTDSAHMGLRWFNQLMQSQAEARSHLKANQPGQVHHSQLDSLYVWFPDGEMPTMVAWARAMYLIYSPIPDSPYVLIVEQDAANYVTRLHQINLRLMITLAVICLIAGVIARFICISIGGPLKHLSDQVQDMTESLQSGNQKEAPDSGIEELSSLASSYNLMQNAMHLYIQKLQNTQLVLEESVADRTLELKEQSNRLRLALVSGDMGVWDYDVINNVLLWDDRMFELYGVKRSDFLGAVEAWQQGLHHDDRERAETELALALKGDIDFQTSFRIIQPSGRVLHIGATAEITRDEDGNAIRMIGVNEDITETVMAQNMLRESQALFDSILNSATNFAIISTDDDGIITEFNRGAENMLGYHRDELIGKQTPLLWHDHEEIQLRSEELSDELNTTIEGFRTFAEIPCMEGSENREWTYIHKNGQRMIVNLIVSQLLDAEGHRVGFVQTAQDITQARFRDSEIQKLSLVASKTNNGVVITDAGGKVEWVNDSFTKITGYTLDEIRDFKPGELLQGDGTNPETVQYMRQRLQEGLPFHVELINYHKDGYPYWIETRVDPVHDENGKLSHFIGVQSEISARKHMEDNIREETQRANELAEKAKAASMAKTEFLANMSHEIRTPMTAILGFTEMLSTDLNSPEFEDERNDAINTIQRNARHLLTIINDILDISKIEAGRMRLEERPTQVLPLVEEIVSFMRVRALEKHIELKLNCQSQVPAVIHTDPLRLRQILVNLIGNAIKFTDKGYVKIILNTRTHTDQRGVLRISVEDTGVGIASNHQESVFDAFTQADNTTTRKFGGTGLGLKISAKLANMLGGHLTMSSTIDEGSTFTLQLPLEKESLKRMVSPENEDSIASKQTSNTHANIPQLTNKRILVAEDGKDNQRLIKHHLLKTKAEVTFVENGKEAVAHVDTARNENTAFDLIFMDIQMPVLDGLKATQQLRKLGITTPIIALTAHAMDTDRQNCLNAGCTDHITKPLNTHKLFEACAQYLGNKTHATTD